MKPFVNPRKYLNRIIVDEGSWKSTKVDESAQKLHIANEYDSFHFRILFGTYILPDLFYESPDGLNSQNVSFCLIF